MEIEGELVGEGDAHSEGSGVVSIWGLLAGGSIVGSSSSFLFLSVGLGEVCCKESVLVV